MSKARPLPSLMLVKRKALRSLSAMPPQNCQRTKRMHLGVLVHGFVDGLQQAGVIQRLEMFLEIPIRTLGGHANGPAVLVCLDVSI